jgi:Lysylphosphatidylglycerol synthase TM region
MATVSTSAKQAVAKRVLPLVLTVLVFAVILRQIPIERLAAALGEADYQQFLAFMIPNTLIYFCWDTLILTVAVRWFHGPISFSAMLPARAVSYVVAFFNGNVAQGLLAAYLARRVGQPVLQLGSTALFLVFTEYTHLVAWATIGLIAAGPRTPRQLLLLPPAVAVFWLLFLSYTRFGLRPWNLLRAARRLNGSPSGGLRNWLILRTFRIAPLRRYGQMVLLRAPMFFASLCFHYFAAQAFGIHIPFAQMVAFLPVIFMIASLPVTIGHLGLTQAAWIHFFGAFAAPEKLLAFSLAAHATFTVSRAMLGVAFTPRAYGELMQPASARGVT